MVESPILGPVYWSLLTLGAVVFWLLPARLRLPFLATASFGYLLSLQPQSIAVLAAWSMLFYFLATRAVDGHLPRKWIIPGLIIGILGYLAYFKYVPTLIDTLGANHAERSVVIPLGISFFTFKLVHYAVEVSRGNVKDRSPFNFLCYIFLFPIFSAGPIERFDHFLSSRDDRFTAAALTQGLTRICYGLIKKFALAELFLLAFHNPDDIKWMVHHVENSGPRLFWQYQIGFYLYAYLDFSAYTDIAIGASRLFGFPIMENFNWPILGINIVDFWKRWHMTLSGWCQTYVYIPVLGLTRNPYLSLYAAFLAIGLWHRGTLNWVCWGLTHATGVAVYQTWARFKRKRGWMKPPGGLRKWAGILVTGLFVSAAFVFPVTDRVAGPYAAVRILAKMFFIDLPDW